MSNSYFTIDVEDWFNILDSPAVPPINKWDKLDHRFEYNLNILLELLAKHRTHATLFWLGWFAEHYPALVRQCAEAGHEIASHGYGHILAYESGQEAFYNDISRAKKLLEDIIGKSVIGFRAAGFSTTDDSHWVFDEIARAGYKYDSSVFPAERGHGGMLHSELLPYVIHTEYGDITEFPQSVVKFAGQRISFFGGGYLRLAPYWLIKYGIKRLQKHKRPLIVYVHPREIDPSHPHLRLSPWRTFKCYVNLPSTYYKLDTLLKQYNFVPMNEYKQDDVMLEKSKFNL